MGGADARAHIDRLSVLDQRRAANQRRAVEYVERHHQSDGVRHRRGRLPRRHREHRLLRQHRHHDADALHVPGRLCARLDAKRGARASARAGAGASATRAGADADRVGVAQRHFLGVRRVADQCRDLQQPGDHRRDGDGQLGIVGSHRERLHLGANRHRTGRRDGGRQAARHRSHARRRHASLGVHGRRAGNFVSMVSRFPSAGRVRVC